MNSNRKYKKRVKKKKKSWKTQTRWFSAQSKHRRRWIGFLILIKFIMGELEILDNALAKIFIPSLSNSCMYSIIASLKYYETKVNVNVKAAPNMVNKRVRIVIKKNMVCFCVSVSKYQEYSNLVTRVCTHTSIGVHVKTHSCIYIYIYIYIHVYIFS